MDRAEWIIGSRMDFSNKNNSQNFTRSLLTFTTIFPTLLCLVYSQENWLEVPGMFYVPLIVFERFVRFIFGIKRYENNYNMYVLIWLWFRPRFWACSSFKNIWFDPPLLFALFPKLNFRLNDLNVVYT